MKYFIILFLVAALNCQFEQLCKVGDIKKNEFNCKIETGNYGQQTAGNEKTIKVMEFNVEDNGSNHESPYERGISGILDVFDQAFNDYDVFVISEVARDCIKYSNETDGVDYLAKHLKLNYAYSPEFIDLKQSELLKTTMNGTQNQRQCTFGNAILSKFPIEQAKTLYFEKQCCMFAGRVGARNSVVAVVKAAQDILVFSAHLESGTGVSDFPQAYQTKMHQMGEMINYAKEIKVQNIFLVGDFNSPLKLLDPIIDKALENGYSDAHSNLYWWDRGTIAFGSGSKIFFTDDYILYKNMKKVSSQICKKKVNPVCYGKSDHYPISAIFTLKE